MPSPPPRPLKLASRGPVILYVPIDRARITSILYHQMGGGDTLDLTPSGNLLNAGIIDRIERQIIGSTATGPDYFIASGSTASVDVGAGAGTQVYSPVNGTIVSITPMILNGAAWGAQLSIQPQSDPGVVVVVSHISADPSLRIGQQVTRLAGADAARHRRRPVEGAEDGTRALHRRRRQPRTHRATPHAGARIP